LSITDVEHQVTQTRQAGVSFTVANKGKVPLEPINNIDVIVEIYDHHLSISEH
jgi:hypothetical protein